MDYIKVKDKNHLERDLHSNGIVNSDAESYNAYLKSYKKAYEESLRLKTLENDVTQIKSDLNEIKNLLQNLSNKSYIDSMV